MDWLTFISSIVSSGAWPLAMLTVVILLRGEIKSLFSIVTKIKAGPVEAEFERGVDNLKREADLMPPPNKASEPLSEEEMELLSLAEINPRSAILESWRLIENSAEKSLEKKGKLLSDKERASIVHLVRELTSQQVLNQEEISILHELRALRNEAAHAKDFSPAKSSVINYLNLASRIRSRMTNNN